MRVLFVIVQSLQIAMLNPAKGDGKGESDEDEAVMKIATMGHQPVLLGGLYSAVQSEFLPGMNLWPEKALENHTNTIDHPKQKSLWTSQQSLDQKFEMLHVGVEGSVQTMIGLGKLNADGSFEYLEEKQDFTEFGVAELHFLSETRTDTLSADITEVDASCHIFRNLPETYKPSHVVTAITYGGDAHFVFTKRQHINFDKMDIDAYLHAKFKKAVFEIEGSFSLNVTENDIRELNDTNIKIYSDFIMAKQPTTVEEALKTFEEISSNFGNKENRFKYASPMHAQLIPIAVYCPESPVDLHAITQELSDLAIKVKDELEEQLLVVAFLLRTTAAIREIKIGTLLRDFQSELFGYLLKYKKEMIDAIVEAKHSGRFEDIYQVLDDHNEGNFKKSKLIAYLTERRRQVAAMNVFYDHSLNKDEPQIREYAKASIPAAMLTKPFVFVLSIGILPDLIADNYESFNPEEQASIDRVDNYWYNREEVVGKISDALNSLKRFFDYNNYKRNSNFFIKFVAMNNSNPQTINLYEYGIHVSDFKLDALLSEEKYKINLQKDGNAVTRNSNSDCTAAGSRITVTISNPNEKYITGVKIFLFPHVPEQNIGQDQFFKTIEREESFDSQESISADFSVNPSYSYHVSVAFTTKYGHLTPSDNYTSVGEFQWMMDSHVGCFVLNDFYFKSDYEVVASPRKPSSAIQCAELCHYSDNCLEGWSYQQATGFCLFIKQAEQIEILQPESHILENNKTVGWATGLKACTVPDKDGQWTDWTKTTNKQCIKSSRTCEKCGEGLDCIGEAVKLEGDCPKPGLDQFLYLSETRILSLPSFKEVDCQQDFPESAMSYASAGVVMDNLMVCGGHGMTTCRIWKEDGWVETATGVNRKNAAASSVDGSLIITGGEDDTTNKILASSMIYTEDAGWEDFTPLPSATYYHCQVSVGDTVYIVGGSTGSDITGDTYKLSMSTRQWVKQSSLNTPRSVHGCAAWDGGVIVVGVYNGVGVLSSVEKFNPVSNKWFTFTS